MHVVRGQLSSMGSARVGAAAVSLLALFSTLPALANEVTEEARPRWLNVSVELGLASASELPSEVAVGLPDSSRHGSVGALRSYEPGDPVGTRVPARTKASAAEGVPLTGLPECTADEVPALARISFVLPPEEEDAPLEGATIRTAPPPDTAPGVCLRKIETWVPTWRESLDAMRRMR